jgi:hypothetical protein
LFSDLILYLKDIIQILKKHNIGSCATSSWEPGCHHATKIHVPEHATVGAFLHPRDRRMVDYTGFNLLLYRNFSIALIKQSYTIITRNILLCYCICIIIEECCYKSKLIELDEI